MMNPAQFIAQHVLICIQIVFNFIRHCCCMGAMLMKWSVRSDKRLTCISCARFVVRRERSRSDAVRRQGRLSQKEYNWMSWLGSNDASDSITSLRGQSVESATPYRSHLLRLNALQPCIKLHHIACLSPRSYSDFGSKVKQLWTHDLCFFPLLLQSSVIIDMICSGSPHTTCIHRFNDANDVINEIKKILSNRGTRGKQCTHAHENDCKYYCIRHFGDCGPDGCCHSMP